LTEGGAHLLTGPILETGSSRPKLPTIPGYDLLEELGRGGMGVVYRAMDLRLKRPVALKMILAGDHAARELHDRFRIEAEAVAHLQHPNIVQIYEIGEHNGLPYFALEYINGGCLTDLLGGKPMPPKVAAELLRALARAMQFAHERGIVHRDLKPANVLLRRKSESQGPKPETKPEEAGSEVGSRVSEFEPKITDFGLAKRMDGSKEQHTRSGSILGTPSYMAPEQAEGRNRDVGPATDIWALGAILYEMLTGRPPFLGATAVDTLLQISHNDPVPPLRLQPRLPRDLDTIVLKCLEREPHKRYASAAALADDLDRFLKDEPIQARPIGPLERAGKWVRRQPTLAALVAVSVLAVLIGLAGVSWYNARLQGLLTQVQKQHEQTRHQVIRLCTNRGMGLTAEGQFLEALPWLAEALRQEDNASARDLHRLRLGMTLEHCPWPERIWFHDGRVTQAAFSPDGHWVMTVSGGSWCKLWDLHDKSNTAKAVTSSPALHHRAPAVIQEAAFSPDSSRIALACDHGKVVVWEFLQGKEVVIPGLEEHTFYHALFSPDSKHIVTASQDSTARVWDLEGRQVVELKHPDEVYDVRFSPDGKQVLTGCKDGLARIWDWAQRKVYPPLEAGSAVNVAIWSADGMRVATGTRKGKAQVWDARKATKIGQEMSHNGSILWVQFSRDGQRLVTTGDDNTARVWDAQTGLSVTSRLKQGSTVYQGNLSPDNRRLVTASDDNTAVVWDINSGERIGSPLVHNGTVYSVCYGASGKILTASSDGTARLWQLSTGGAGDFQMKHDDPVRQVRCSPTGDRLVTASDDGTARVWDTKTGRQLFRLDQGAGGAKESSRQEVIDARFSPNQGWIVTASADGLVRFWSAADGSPREARIWHQGGINGLELSPNGRLVVTAGKDDHSARLWQTSDGKPTGVVLRHKGEVARARFDPTGQRVLTASADGTAQVWDAAKGAELGQPLKHKEAIRDANWNHDGSRVVTASADRTGRVWDPATSNAITEPLVHNGGVLVACFNADGRLVATGSEDNTARIWDSTTGTAVTRPLAHQGSVQRVRFSPDSRMLATASCDSTACVWDLDLNLPLTPPLEHQVDVVDVIFLPDGQSVATASLDSTARLWHLHREERPVDDLVRIAHALSGGGVDTESGFTRLQPRRLHDLWQEVRQRYPDNLILPRDLPMTNDQ
jgi:WD40 repeat protein